VKATQEFADNEALAAWRVAYEAYLDKETTRLRLLLQRQALWNGRRTSEVNPNELPHEPWVNLAFPEVARRARLEFFEGSAQGHQLTESLMEVEKQIGRELTELRKGGSPPIDLLVQLFGLSRFERDVLLLCMACEVDPAFEECLAPAQGDARLRRPTPRLAISLFEDGGGGGGAALDSFVASAPLRRFGLLVTDSETHHSFGLMNSFLRLDEAIVAFLRGVSMVNGFVLDHLESVDLVPLPKCQSDVVENLRQFLLSRIGLGRLPVVNFVGPSGAGKRAIARVLAEKLGLGLCSLKQLPSANDRRRFLQLLEREAALHQFAVYLDKEGFLADEPDSFMFAASALQRLGLMLFVGSREPWKGEREAVAITVPKPTAEEQRRLWTQALAGLQGISPDWIERVVQQFDLGPTAIAETVVAARNKAMLRGRDNTSEIAPEELWQTCRERASFLDGLAQKLPLLYTWDDLVLPKEIFRQLREIAAQVSNRYRVYETWGFGKKLSRGRGISALFSGPSGTGKTMAAEVLADYLKLDLYRIDLSGVVSKYIGETEKNLAKVFDAAERCGAVLLFDEADALFGKRTEVKDSHDRYANIEVDYLLQRMEGYQGLAILATNRKAALDRSFLRRLRFLVDFPVPDYGGRMQIWRQSFPSEAPRNGIDYEFLARLEIPGGSIRNIALNAAFLASEENTPIGMKHVLHTARGEYAKTDRLVTEAEFGRHYTEVVS